MVQVRYVAPLDPKAEIAVCRPAMAKLEQLRLRYAPGSPQYLAIIQAREALNRMALAVAGEPLIPAHVTPPSSGAMTH